MNVTENEGVYQCDCGFSWTCGNSGQHYCEDGLRAKLAALTAENAALKLKGRELLSEAGSVYEKFNLTVDREVGNFADGQTLQEFDFLLTIGVPATDAFLAEVRAQGVEMFAKEMHADISEADAIEFAAQLRQEAAQ